MNNSHSIAVEQGIINKLQIKEIVFVLAFSVLLQLLIHIIPSGGTPLGTILLPMFYAPFIAVLFYRIHVALSVALLSPILNYLITGNPAFGMIGILSLELVVFVTLAKLFSSRSIFTYINAPVSFLLAKGFSSLAILIFPWFYSKGNSLDYYFGSFQKNLIGLIVLFLVNYFSIKLYKDLKKQN
jgi:hypothetical protein